jgi:hypothetical protein
MGSIGGRGHHRARPRFRRPSSRPPTIGMRTTTSGMAFRMALSPNSAPGPNSIRCSQRVTPPMRDAMRPLTPPAKIASATMAISLRRTQMRNAAGPRTGCVIERRCRRSEAVLERWALSCVECWRAATVSELVFRPDLSVMTRLAYSLGGPWPYCGARTRGLAQVGERRTARSDRCSPPPAAVHARTRPLDAVQSPTAGYSTF